MSKIEKKKIIEIPKTNSRIGVNSFYNGTLRFQSSIGIMGKVEGNIIGGELLIVHPSARVSGDILVDYLLAIGEISGNIHAKKGILLFRGSRVRASILSAVIKIQSGADVEGDFNLSIEEETDIFSVSREAYYTRLFDKLVHELEEINTKFSV